VTPSITKEAAQAGREEQPEYRLVHQPDSYF